MSDETPTQEAEESCTLFTDAEFKWIGICLLVLIVIGLGLFASGKL